MRMRKGIRKIVSLVTAGIMAVSLLTVGGHNGVSEAAETMTYDSTSAVNFSTVFGRAVDYGVLADTYTQLKHTETNFAVKTYHKDIAENDDPDLCGEESLSFIIGAVTGTGNGLRFAKTYCDKEGTLYNMIFNIETTQEVKTQYENSSLLIDGDARGRATVEWKVASQTAINNNITQMIGKIQSSSKELWEKTATINIKTYETDNHITDWNHYNLDINKPEYKNAVVYVSVPTDSVFFKSMDITESINIIKDPSTIVVFNVQGEDIKLNKFGVTVDGTKVTSETNNGQSTAHNDDVDEYICQKVIWNFREAKKVTLDTVAGAFLVPDDNAVVTNKGGASCGWIATGGMVNGDAEWHYIYKNRSKHLNTDKNGQMHFAIFKRFTDSFENGFAEQKLKNVTSILIQPEEYTLEFYEADSNYNTTGSPTLVKNDDDSKITFPVLTFTDKGSGTYYYVIKEANANKVKDGIKNADGEIDIKLDVTVTDGIYGYKITSYQYLTQADKATNKSYKDNNEVELSGVEFSLGGFYNLVTNEANTDGSLKVIKNVAIMGAEPKSTYRIAVKNSAGKYVTSRTNDKAYSDTPVYFEVGVGTAKAITFSNLPAGNYQVEEDTDSANIPTYKLTSVTGVGEDVVVTAGTTPAEKVITNTYTKITPAKIKVKKVTNETGAPALAGATFVVSKDGKKVDEWTTVKSGTGIEHEITFDEPGTYVIHESVTPDGYVKADDVTINVELSGTTLVAKKDGSNITSTINIVNDKTIPDNIGSITINKSIVGDIDESKVTAGAKFTVTRTYTKDGAEKTEYLNPDGTFTATAAAIPLSSFDKIAGVYTKSFTKLEIAKNVNYTYKIEETGYEVTGYTATVKYPAGQSATLNTASVSKIFTVTDTYTENAKKGNLVLVKTIKGELTKEEKEGKLSFTVTGPGYEKTFHISDDPSKEGEALIPSGDTYKLTLNGLPVGTYTVKETTEAIDGKKVEVKYSIGVGTALAAGDTATVAVTNGTTKTVNFENNYTKEEPKESTGKGIIVIRKFFGGEALTKEQKDKITFTIAKDGKEVKTVTFKEALGVGDITVADLEVGDYTVTETQHDVTGLKAATVYKVVVPGKDDAEGTGAAATVAVGKDAISRVEFTNTYTKEEATTTQQVTTEVTTEATTAATTEATTQATTAATTESVSGTKKSTSKKATTEDDEDKGDGNLIITIYDEKTGDVVPGAKITVTSPSGKETKYTTNDDGQVTLKNIAAGEYKVTVTDVPEGYTVTENAEVSIQVVKNKTTKAQVRIDKDGEVSVSSKTTKSATKTGDTVPVVPIATAFIIAVLGLIILMFKRRENA